MQTCKASVVHLTVGKWSLNVDGSIVKVSISRVPTRGTFADRNLCGCGLESGSAQDLPRIRPSELFRPAQNVLQRRRSFSEPLVARRFSVVKRLGLPCGAFETTGSERVRQGSIILIL